MSRKLRQIPAGGSLVEVTCRTIQGRLLMRPSSLLNDIILGVLGRAQRLYEVEIVGYSFLSNHYHLLLWVDRADRLSDFMRYFQGNVAREIARLTGWKDRVWADRYDAIQVTDEEEAQVKRLTYVLSNCVKENLVARVTVGRGCTAGVRCSPESGWWRGPGLTGGWSTTLVCEGRSQSRGSSRGRSRSSSASSPAGGT